MTMTSHRCRKITAPASLLALLASLLLLMPLLGGCATEKGNADEISEDEDSSKKDKESEDGEEDDKEEAVPVEAVALTRGEIESLLRFSSNLEAENTVQVYSQAARLVTAIYVEEGDEVRRGQVLVRLQDEEQKSALAMVESQLAKARREHERQKSLFAQDLISEQNWNDAVYNLEQLQIGVTDARRDLGYTEVTAPISGIVTNRLVKLGDHVQLNHHLFDLVDFDSIVARLYVPERELGRLALGQPVRIHAESLGEIQHEASVIRVSPVVDPRTGTVKVTVGVPRTEGLVPGMFVESELVTAVHSDALLVPKRAIVYDGDQAYVFRIGDEDRVERVALKAILEDNEHIEPVDGLAEGDRIVIAGQAGLKPNALVRVVG